MHKISAVFTIATILTSYSLSLFAQDSDITANQEENKLFTETQRPKNPSSAAAFKKFLASSPNAVADMSKTKSDESLSAACFNSGTSLHNGVTIKKSGTIYTWIMPDSDDKEMKKPLGNNKKIADKIFALKESSNFDKDELDYKIDGTSYCYVRSQAGSALKQINWPKNEIIPGRKKVPADTKKLFMAIIDATLPLAKQNPVNPQK